MSRCLFARPAWGWSPGSCHESPSGWLTSRLAFFAPCGSARDLLSKSNREINGLIFSNYTCVKQNWHESRSKYPWYAVKNLNLWLMCSPVSWFGHNHHDLMPKWNANRWLPSRKVLSPPSRFGKGSFTSHALSEGRGVRSSSPTIKQPVSSYNNYTGDQKLPH